jgi:hypothetical protein
MSETDGFMILRFFQQTGELRKTDGAANLKYFAQFHQQTVRKEKNYTMPHVSLLNTSTVFD